MRFLSTPVSRKFLSYIDTRNNICHNTWKGYKMFRNSSNRQSIMLLRGEKSAEILKSGLIWEINQRRLHINPKKKLIEDENIKYPNLLDFILFPLLRFYITARVDRNFKQNDFIQGAKQALSYIMENIVNQNVSALNEITTPECFDKLMKNVEALSEKDKRLLLFEKNMTSSDAIGSIKLEYPNNGSHNELLALKILFSTISMKVEPHEETESFKLKFYFAEFKRIYGEQIKSPWIVSAINVHIMELPAGKQV